MEVQDGATDEAAREAVADLLGPGTSVQASLGEVRRLLTHRALRLSLFGVEARAETSTGEYVEMRWVTPAEAQRLGMSAAMEAALQKAAQAPKAAPLPARRAR